MKRDLLAGLAPIVFAYAPPAFAQEHGPVCAAPAGVTKPWLDKSLTADCRADLLIGKLQTADAKVDAFATEFAAFGVPAAHGGDGPVGPTHARAVSLPTPLSLGATFDPDLVAAAGHLVGQEFRAGGMTRMLGPTLDIARSWHFGRSAEDFGEDPVLIADMATPYVRAIQAEGVATTLKHFAVYTQEQGRIGDLPVGQRPSVNVLVSEKALRELYLPGFRAAVVDGGALGIMCAFPRVNGAFACENRHLLGILKNEWGFRGTVVPDFPDAQRSVIEAVNAGLDSGNFGLPRPALPQPPSQPGAPAGPPPAMMTAMGLDRIPGGMSLRQAVRDGRISETRLDDLLHRTLVTSFALDGIPARDVDWQQAQMLAQQLAVGGTVLLRNERSILPLGESVRSVAIIGTQAGASPQIALTGSATIDTKPRQSVLDAFTEKAGTRAINYAAGDSGLDALPPIATDLLRTRDGKPGLQADYVANANLDFAGPTLASRIEPSVQSNGSAPLPGLPADHQWSVRWTGRLVPRVTGLHRLTISGAGSARLIIGGKQVASFARVDFGDIQHAALALQTGRPVDIEIDYTPREAAPTPVVIPMMATTLGAYFRLGLVEPDDRIARAVAAAKQADVAIVFAANRQGEGADRTSLSLPADQDALIAAVAAVNPRTVVVLSTGGPVAMSWRDKVAGIVQTWYAGESFGPAVASVLLGQATPGGRLPMTFPADERQGPVATAAHYPGITDAKGQLSEVRFDEGTLVGYRWHLAHPAEKPLYPFGYGLSFGMVQRSGYSVTPQGDGSLKVHVALGNVGTHEAVEVAQAYLVLPGEGGQSVPKLAGFAKATISPGQSLALDFIIPANRFDYWDAAAGGWKSWHGAYELRVGRSAVQTDYRRTLTR